MITEVKRRAFLPYFIIGVITFYLGHLCTKLYINAPGINDGIDIFSAEKINYVLDNLAAFNLFDIDFTFVSVQIGLLCFSIIMLFYLRIKRVGYYRYGEEHGSARYATKEELSGFVDSIYENNLILSQEILLGIWNDRLPFLYQSNKNIFLIGGSGDGKTHTYLKPNALQDGISKIFTDTKGVLVHQLGNFYRHFAYKIKVIDFINFVNSDQFNPFVYMKNEMDIDRVSEAIVKATKKSDNQGEDFWIQAEGLLTRALIGYLYFDSQINNYLANLAQITDLIRYLRRTDSEIPSPVEELFADLERELPGNYACKQFDLFNKNFDGETKNSVFAIIAARFSVFSHEDVKRLLERDTLEIDTWQKEKTVVFINIPETNEAYQFLSALLFSLIFDVSIRTADHIIKGIEYAPNGLLHLHIFGDEFANVGKILDFEKHISVIRSREISVTIMVQSESQIVKLYGKEDAKTIMNNCATRVYLGTNDDDTATNFSKRAGNQTIQDSNQSENRGVHGSSNTQYNKMKRELLDNHEIMTLPMDEVLVFLNRQKAFRDKKANVNNHPLSSYLANSPKDKNWYRYTKYMSDIDEFLAHVKPSQLIEVTAEEIEQAFVS